MFQQIMVTLFAIFLFTIFGYSNDKSETLTNSFNSDIEILWELPTHDMVQSSPTVIDGTVYIGSHTNNLLAIDAFTGTLKWFYQTDGGIYSSPNVVDGTVYVGSLDNSLYALNAETGNEEWKFTTEEYIYSSPTVYEGIVYIGSYDNNLYALDAETGSVVWTYQTEGHIRSSPTIVGGIVYFGSADSTIYALDAETGDMVWTHITDGVVNSSPTVADGIVYIGSGDGHLYALNADDGTVIWLYHTGTGFSSPTVLNGLVYVGSGQNLYAIDVVTGEPTWIFETDGSVTSSPTVVGDMVLVGSTYLYLYAINAISGSEIWRENFGIVGLQQIISSPTVVDGIVYIGRSFFLDVSFSGAVNAIILNTGKSSGDSRVSLGTLGHHHNWTGSDIDTNITDFYSDIAVSDDNEILQTLTIGTAPDATTGFDEQYDQFAPPEPPAGAFDARIRHDDEDYLRFFKPTTTVTTTWNVRFQYSEGGEPITISWSPSDFENVDGEFRLLDTFGGDLINVDMREDTAYTVETTTINQVNIVHTMLSTVGIPFDAGWNMIGIPVQKDNTYYQDVFTGAVENSLWGFANGYYNAEELQIGEGYWLRFHEQGEALLTGTPVNELEIPLAGDWNMITGISCGVGINDVADPEGIIIAGTLFEFDEVYVETASIEPGNGYWIRTEEEGIITLSCNDSSPQGTITTSALHDAETLSASFHTISITNTRGGTQYLYFGGELDEGVMHESYTLPPLPPQEAFDVRFAGDRYLTEGTEGDIRIQASDEQFPLTVAFEPVDEHTYVITEYRDNEPVGEHILDGMAEIELINSDIDRIGLRKYGGEVQDIPEQYALSQNYPNPFNPVTTIQYQLPGETKVRLEVYSMLGQRVNVLVNEVQEAGYYTVEWDGRNASGREVASGVYLYRIQAGEFVRTKKLLFTK